MANKMDRPSPSKSATLFKVGTKKKGNDGNVWIIKENSKGVKKWYLYRKVMNKTQPSSQLTYNINIKFQANVKLWNEKKSKSYSVEKIVPLISQKKVFKKIRSFSQPMNLFLTYFSKIMISKPKVKYDNSIVTVNIDVRINADIQKYKNLLLDINYLINEYTKNATKGYLSD